MAENPCDSIPIATFDRVYSESHLGDELDHRRVTELLEQPGEMLVGDSWRCGGHRFRELQDVSFKRREYI